MPLHIQKTLSATVLAFLASGLTSRTFAAPGLLLPKVTVGQSLEAVANIALTEKAPSQGLRISVTSDSPALLLLSQAPDGPGSASITIMVQPGLSRTPDFYLYGLAKTGSATYTAVAPGFGSTTAIATFAPSGILLKGPSAFGSPLFTTIGAGPSTIAVYAAVLGPAGEFQDLQSVAGGRAVNVNITSSNPLVGAVRDSRLTIVGGTALAATTFLPTAEGKIMVFASVPEGFTAPAQYAALAVTVIIPGLAITDQVAIGHNLQLGGILSLGQPAPPAGLQVALTSGDPAKLLLSRTATEIGSKSITIRIPAGGITAAYYVQALGDVGTVSYVATAPGYSSRTATVTLTPSGVVVGVEPPDEAEVFRPEASEYQHGRAISLAATHEKVPVNVYLVQLDPKTLKGADISVQPLRPGVSVTVEVRSSDPAIATILSPVTVNAGDMAVVAPVTPLKEGSTVISVLTPSGFTTARNSTSFTLLVKK